MSVLEATLWNSAYWNTANSPDRLKINIVTAGQANGVMSEEEENKVTLALFNELLELGAPVSGDSALRKPGSKSLLALLIECHADISVLKRVVAAGAKIDERPDDCTVTPLASAIKANRREAAKWLVELGADVNASWGHGIDRTSILAEACALRPWQRSLIQLLIEKGADVDPSYSKVPRSPVQTVGYVEMDVIIMLLEHGLKINEAKGDGLDHQYVVDIAAARGQLDLLKVLVESGGESVYPGLSGFDRAFFNAYVWDHPGILMFLEQLTGIQPHDKKNIEREFN
ncbi:hypothetical protein PG995_010625 [Apiospora arundinis]